MKITIQTNSQSPIGVAIEHLVSQAEDVFIASAYISAKAVETLAERMRRRGTTDFHVDILFGLDAETDMQAVHRAYDAACEFPDQLSVRYTPHRSGRLFHPKVYYFRCRATCHILITSANLTEAGHQTNEEMYCHLEVPTSHDAVAQFEVIRQAWLSEPFSAVLDSTVVDAKAGIQYLTEELKQAEKHFGQVISGIREGIKIPIPAPDVLAPLRAVLANGYIIVPSFSLSNLYVSIQDILKPSEDARPAKENQVVIFRSYTSASVSLLAEETIKKFGTLQRSARDLCETYSIPTASGQYVPQSAHPALSKAIKTLEREHNKLLNSSIKSKAAISSHLKNKLEEECRQVWQALNPDLSSPFPSELLPEVRKRVEDRRRQISDDPANTLRFSFQAYPHPLVLMNQMPGHIAWQLQSSDPDQEIVRSVIALLRGQVTLIKGVTQWTKPTIVQRDYDRVRLLIALKGKTTDSLLRSLSAWVRGNRMKIHGQTTEQKKLQLLKKAQAIRQKADEHLQWLLEVESLEQNDAVKKLRDEYSLV